MEGEAAARRFLALLKRRPWLERWHGLFANGAYSGNLAAAARNNLGAALLDQGRLAAARAQPEDARRLDDRYALPLAILALLATGEGDGAGRDLAARERGHAGGVADRLLRASGARWAATVGAASGPSAGEAGR